VHGALRDLRAEKCCVRHCDIYGPKIITSLIRLFEIHVVFVSLRVKVTHERHAQQEPAVTPL